MCQEWRDQFAPLGVEEAAGPQQGKSESRTHGAQTPGKESGCGQGPGAQVRVAVVSHRFQMDSEHLDTPQYLDSEHVWTRGGWMHVDGSLTVEKVHRGATFILYSWNESRVHYILLEIFQLYLEQINDC